jgi:hypothetical protein
MAAEDAYGGYACVGHGGDAGDGGDAYGDYAYGRKVSGAFVGRACEQPAQ